MSKVSATSIQRTALDPATDADSEAWHRRAEVLYKSLRGPARGLIRRAYGSAFGEDEIEDLYSSAWLGTLRALERRHTEFDDDSIRSYLLTAVANQASKELRRRQRRPIAPLEAAGAVAETGATPEDTAAAREDDSVTKDVLSSLPPRRRAVMLLRYGWGLEPKEVCRLVDGLSPRAYRREVTRGVDELVRRIKLVEDDRWCEEREPVLKAYAAGVADQDQVLQARHHLSHCRRCHEFVGKLTGQLHEIGSAVAIPGMLEAVDTNATFLERLGAATERVRDGTVGAVSRSESTDVLVGASQARGAGTVAAAAAAKLAGVGSAAKVALACLGGGIAATACVATGVLPSVTGDRPDHPVGKIVSSQIADEPIAPDSVPVPAATALPVEEATTSGDHDSSQTEPTLAEQTPAPVAEFGVETGAAPTSSRGSGPSSASSATSQEFGP